MRRPALIVVAFLLGVPAGADDGFRLHLETLPIASYPRPDASSQSGHGQLSIDAERSIGGPDSYQLVSHSAATPRTDREYRLALWNSPMGRLYYDRAAAEAMLGREGLVGGGRMLGLGMATVALGDGDPGGLQLLLDGEPWRSLSLAEKAEAGVQASFVAALLYFMVENAH